MKEEFKMAETENFKSDKNHEPKKKLIRKSASMKLKRSWLFPAFRLGGNSHQINPQPNPESQKSSLVRRSSSRLNVASDVALNPSAEDYGSTTTPILLSVRKRSTSDSGYSGEDSCYSSESPSLQTTKKNTNGLSFLRLFHKSSATLQLQHPKGADLNPNKPYKGTVMTSIDHQRKKKEFLKRKLPLVPMASSSLSSLNTLQNGKQLRAGVIHSSSNSVISSEESDSPVSSSNYDSGAFSRSSSPTELQTLNRLALAEPLIAPKLVLAACRGEWPLSLSSPVSPIKAKKTRARSMSAIKKEDVTVSVNANTKLTIGSPRLDSRSSNLRRSRSGLPVLGTNALRSSPVKPLRSNIRTKISTVYLEEPKLNRSGSIVTVMGSKPANIKCDCNERVTVNGQHHCVIDLSKQNSGSAVDRSTNTTPVLLKTNIIEI